jgi:hypothetical protein
VSLEYHFNNDNPDLDIAERHRDIQNLLWKHQCEVTFTKVNGEVRTMPCTLMASALPDRDAATLHETRLFKPETLSVWCLDKSEWRSFKTANVTHIRVLS